jgi:hypothetical protein
MLQTVALPIAINACGKEISTQFTKPSSFAAEHAEL